MFRFLLVALLALVLACSDDPASPSRGTGWDLASASGDAVPVQGVPDGFLKLWNDGTFRLALWSTENEEPRQADFTGTFTEAEGSLTLTVARFCTAHVGPVSTCPASPDAVLSGSRGQSEITVTGTGWEAVFMPR